MKITSKEQMQVGKKVREMTLKGYSKAEIVTAIQKNTIQEFIDLDISKKKES